MPPLTIIKPLGWATFMSKGLKMPSEKDFQKPKDNKQYLRGTLGSWPATPQFMPFFQPQHLQGYHTDSADEVGKIFKDFHDVMCDAVKFGHDMWRLQAKFSGLKVMAVVAAGQPGCLKGPELEGLIKKYPKCASMTGNMAKHRDAVAKGVSICFKRWQDKVTVPGLPWYPAFAVFPGPQAAPLPNVPMPLITCMSAKMTDITTPNSMKKEMTKALDSGLKKKDKDKQHEVLHESIATTLSVGFMLWLVAQQVNLCLGRGPIPTFAPPVAPVGPVVAGANIAAPGHVIA